MRRQGSRGWEVRQGTTSQRCVYAVRADFPGLCSMDFYYASPFISTNFNHFIHISQATFWCQNLCVPIALESKGKIQRWKSQWERKKRWKVPNQLNAYVQSNVFFTFCHFKNTHVPWQDWKSSSKDNAIVRRLWILFQSQNASSTGSGGVLIIPAEKDFFKWIEVQIILVSLQLKGSNDDVERPSW